MAQKSSVEQERAHGAPSLALASSWLLYCIDPSADGGTVRQALSVSGSEPSAYALAE